MQLKLCRDYSCEYEWTDEDKIYLGEALDGQTTFFVNRRQGFDFVTVFFQATQTGIRITKQLKIQVCGMESVFLYSEGESV